MRIFISVKTTLRAMVANGAVTLCYFIGFPIIIALFMNFVQGNITKSALTLDRASIYIVDEDNSNFSKVLIEFLQGDEGNKIVEIEKEEGSKISEIIIPKGYDEAILKGEKVNVEIKVNNKSDRQALNILRLVLDNYHQGIYLNMNHGDNEELIKVLQSKTIESLNIISPEENDNKAIYVTSMLEFVISMLLYGMILGSYAPISKNMDRRINSIAISHMEGYFCDFIGYMIYSFIILGAYVLFFKTIGLGFKGNIFGIIFLIMMAALFISSIGNFVVKVFGEKLGKIVGNIMFILPILGMKMFTGEGNFFNILAPTSYVTKAFESFSIGKIQIMDNKYLWGSLIGSILCIVIALLKIKIVERRQRKCA